MCIVSWKMRISLAVFAYIFHQLRPVRSTLQFVHGHLEEEQEEESRTEEKEEKKKDGKKKRGK